MYTYKHTNQLFIETCHSKLQLITCLNFTSFLFIVGFIGIVWNRKNMMVMLLSMELMFFSLVLNFIFLSSFTDQTLGQIYSLLIIATAASETVIGLGLLIVVFRLSNKIDYKSLVVLRG